ncbi:DEAD/DEAH box helicase, partial [Sulfurimonas sp.]
MNLTSDQEAKFKKLGINSYLELALLIPHTYEDYTLYDTLHTNQAQVIDATVESVYKAPNSIQISFFAHNLGHSVQGVLFRPKAYMLHQFKVAERDYYFGSIDCKQGHCSMSMPKKISKVGKITPKYKTALRTDVMLRLVESCLTKKNLEDEGLKEDIVQTILKLHFPTEEQKNISQLDEKSTKALKYVELYAYMKLLAGKRRYFSSVSSTQRDYLKWSETLPFKLTHEQLNAIEDIKADLKKDVAAKRMVVGDVGSGKTMVILAAAYMMLPNRSILMAPTTILANQLYEEAIKFLPNVKIILVTNKTKKVDLQAYDFIIGTHALLYRELPNAALVMVDEQHRFGTIQRNKLEKLVSLNEKRPHYLQFSATPIPRTQA